jgi:processive 1,2-diacylglycerol beta-glucosyltransferase
MVEKALILSASAGAGHLRAADAVAAAYKTANPDAVVKHIDTLEFTNKAFRDLYSKAYLEMIRVAPHSLGWLYDHLDKPFRNEKARNLINKINLKPFMKMLEEENPTVAICTHFLPAEIISNLKDEGKVSFPQGIVVTDLDVHAMWLCRTYEHYFVAMEETRVHLTELGVPEKKVTVSGIPIDPIFSRELDKKAARKELGLDPEKTTILMSAGGFGVGPVEAMVSGLAKLKHSVQVVAVCGKNADLKAKIEGIVKKFPKGAKAKVHPIGFTKEMDKYMSASDILLGKPGGLTSSEALAKGLALIIVNPIPGQEMRNSDHYLEEGVAIRCNNLPTLAFKIERLLDNPEKLAAMQAASRALAKPSAAHEVVRVARGLKGGK